VAAVEAGDRWNMLPRRSATSDLYGVYPVLLEFSVKTLEETLSIRPRVVRRYEVPWGARE
jgi:hypothetical protein